jgi:hypothetical protein
MGVVAIEVKEAAVPSVWSPSSLSIDSLECFP